MIIQCEKCNRKFQIDDSRLSSPGGTVRCWKCGHVFAIDKKHIYADEVESKFDADGVMNTDDRDYLENRDSEIRGKKESKSQKPSLSPDSDPVSAEKTEIAEEQKADTPQGFKFKYPLSGNVTGTAAEEHSLYSKAPEEKNDGDYDKVAVDEGNWEEFVTISKAERDIEEFKIKDTRKTRAGESGFDWENLRINDEPIDAQRGLPKMFEDEGMDSEEIGLIGNERSHEPPGVNDAPRESGNRERAYEGSASDERLSVDMDVLITNPHAATRTGGSQRPPYYDSNRMRSRRNKSNGGGILSKVAYGVLTIVVFTVIVAASYIILSNTGIIPENTAQNIEKVVESVIPFDIAEPLRKDVVITENRGMWLDTRNGPMYVISGTVKNESRHSVSYIKIKSEFISDGQTVYDNVVYAGNTFTENELKSSPLRDTLLKLKKKSGNIDFYNPEKLAGLNTDIRPGQSIPFYSVFPAAGRMLGLKYNLEVVDYEESP